jgi:hypothetical protein
MGCLDINDREPNTPRLFDQAKESRYHRQRRADVFTSFAGAPLRADKIVLDIDDD